MRVQSVTPILNVSHIGASIAWFERLGWERRWTYHDDGSIEGGAVSDGLGPADFGGVGRGLP